MTAAEFIVKYQNKKVDYDRAFGPQCVDLFRQYCNDMGIPHTGAVEGAKELWFKFAENGEKLYFNRLNALQAKLGDVLIEDSTETNRYGHVSIVVAVQDKDNVLVLQQDGFAQDGCKLGIRNLKNALGILRRK
jgi:hypothetical protein